MHWIGHGLLIDRKMKYLVEWYIFKNTSFQILYSEFDYHFLINKWKYTKSFTVKVWVFIKNECFMVIKIQKLWIYLSLCVSSKTKNVNLKKIKFKYLISYRLELSQKILFKFAIKKYL